MVAFSRASATAMREAHARARPSQTGPGEPATLNVPLVIELDAARMFAFRGRPYIVPPLPMLEGLQIMTAWQEAASCGQMLTATSREKYYAALNKLPPMLRRNCRPAGRIRRMLWPLSRNPFRRATEAELVELASFFLLCRTSATGFSRGTTLAASRR